MPFGHLRDADNIDSSIGGVLCRTSQQRVQRIDEARLHELALVVVNFLHRAAHFQPFQNSSRRLDVAPGQMLRLQRKVLIEGATASATEERTRPTPW